MLRDLLDEFGLRIWGVNAECWARLTAGANEFYKNELVYPRDKELYVHYYSRFRECFNG